jgi:sensor histidine kinase YesM
MPSAGFFHLLFIGITFFQAIFILVQYTIYKRSEYQFYFLYILSITIYLYISLEQQIGFTHMHTSYPQLVRILNIPLMMFAFWMYILFGKKFIEPHYVEKIKRYVYWIERTFVSAIIVNVCIIPFHLSDNTINYIFLPLAFLVFIQGMIIFFKLYFQKDPLNNFLLAGGFLIAVGGITGPILSLFLPNMGLGNPLIYYALEASVLCELLLLNTGLVYKTIFIQKKVNTAQQLFFEEFQKNKILQHEITETGKQVAEIQLAALSAQMNPHFIFNCMNSIQKYVLKNEKDNAINFLQNFSELMRNVLENSGKTKIMLDEEINILEKYIKLEQQRLDGGFDYRIEISAGLQTDFFEIPGMLIQPYVENAIWHGIMNITEKDKKGLLTIKFMHEEHYIKCIVEDNGVGRKKAAVLENQKSPQHKSFGMAISQKRLALLKAENEDIPEIKIEDLFCNGKPAGTRVSIFIYVA